MVLVARFGAEHGGSVIWVGIAGSRQPAQTARSMARAAGAHLGERGVPPWRAVPGWRWRVGVTEPAPARSEKDATEAYLRAVDERTIPEQPTFADICADHFSEDDMFVALCRPASAPVRVQATCVTTAPGLDVSFTEAAEMRRSLAWPGMPLLFAAAASTLAASAGHRYLSGGIWPLAAISAVTGLLAVRLGWRSVRVPPLLASLHASRAPRLPRGVHRGKLLPVWQLGEWSAGDALTGTSAPMLPAPAEALGQAGAPIGEDSSGQPCRLPDAMRYRGVIAYGDPGSGKTTFLLSLLAHDAARRARGEHLGIVWIETKGEGAERAAKVMSDHGAVPLMLMGSRPVGPCLDLVDRSKPAEAGRLLTEAIRYAFEADDIHQASADVLASSLQAAAAFPAEAASDIGVGNAGQPNLIRVAFKVLGGSPDEFTRVKQVLAAAVPEQHRAGVERYYRRREWEFERIVEPAKNKLKDLSSASGLFEAGTRERVSFAELLDAAQPVVLNLGRTRSDDEPDSGEAALESMYTETTAQRAAAIAMFLLWHTVQEHCDNWQSMRRSVAVYSDELRDIAGFGKHGLEVVQAMADQGRSRGVLAAFATQRPDQLHPSTRTAVDSFATQAYFRLRAVEAATAASEQLYEAFTPPQISALPQGWCAVSLAAEGRTPAAFTLHPAHIG